ncbi:hypothetical protein M3Y97_00099100 [Aphelenchoides bicaudatus]|nr:hypothetical protein M3Y97_00099100 [Aphelenchoides bicaudatus]
MNWICKFLIFATLLVFQTHAEEEEDYYSDCKENECPFGQTCIPEGKHSHYCRLSGLTIACISVSCFIFVCLIPIATVLLLYCLGIAADIKWIQDFFKRAQYRFRSHTSSQRHDEGPASNLNSRRKRQIKHYLENKENEHQRDEKGRIIRKPKLGIARQPVFVRAMSKSQPQSRKSEPQSDFDFNQTGTKTSQTENDVQVSTKEVAVTFGEEFTQETPSTDQQQNQNQYTEHQIATLHVTEHPLTTTKCAEVSVTC